MAKEDRETPAPTGAPTKKPKEKDTDKEDEKEEEGNGVEDEPATKKPTTSPTKPPTLFPTKTPTFPPTRDPTQSPTRYPTRYPTFSPTDAPSPYPTLNPSAEPTPAPVEEPTEVTAGEENEPTEVTMAEVRLESIIMDLETDGGTVDSAKLEEDMEFLLNDEILHRVYDSFSHVDLELMLVATDRTRRQLQTGYVAEIEGTAFFRNSGDVPTPEELSEFLYTYFSIYDSDDLTVVVEKENPAISKAEVRSVNGVDVDTQSLNKDTEGGSSGSSPVPIAALVGLVTGAVCLIVAVAALIWIRRKNNDAKKGSVATPDRTVVASPHEEMLDSIDVEDELSVGVSSIDDSIYTHNSNLIIRNPPPRREMALPIPDLYDANRLDKVLDDAHSFTRDLSFEKVYSEDSNEVPPAITNPVSF